MEREKTRLLEEAAAKQAAAAAIDRDMAELDRLAALAAKYNFVVVEAPPAAGKTHFADGTVASLAHLYCTIKRSPFHKVRYKTRENYKNLVRRIIADCGDMRLVDLKTQNIERLYEGWTEGGKMATAHSLVTMLRMLFGFGATILEDGECERLSVVMHKMRFSMAKRLSSRLTTEQASAIRAMAHQMKRPSIALAQALQFECMLGQKDVIGEWVPLSEPGTSDIVANDKKWLWGIRWSEIDDNLILRSTSNKLQKQIDLRRSQMVTEELKRLGKQPTSGPVIVCEYSGLPWTSYEFRRWWRKVADACGVPKHVKNMDSRARKNDAGENQGLVSEEIRATEEAPSVARR
jgi:hypothetical protein